VMVLHAFFVQLHQIGQEHLHSLLVSPCNSVTDDSTVQRVVFGLTNPQSVSIGQFFVYAGDLVRYGGRVAGFDNAWVDNDA